MNINIYNPYVRREIELYHHGIEGQKWGKKNGPPYPLSKEDYSAAEKKAKGYKKQLNHLAASRSTASYNSLNNAYEADKVNAKLKKEISKHGENSRKAKELQEKFDYFNSKTEESFAEIDKLDKEIKRISDQLEDEGFELWTATYNTNAHLGDNTALMFLTGMLFGRGKDAWYKNMRFDVTADAEKIYEARQKRSGNKSEKESKNERERIGSYDVEWDEDTGEIKSVKDGKGNKASLDDVLEEQERNERRRK